MITSEDILGHSIEIVRQCIDGIFVACDPIESGGVQIERRAAVDAGIPVYEIYKWLPDWAKVIENMPVLVTGRLRYG